MKIEIDYSKFLILDLRLLSKECRLIWGADKQYLSGYRLELPNSETIWLAVFWRNVPNQWTSVHYVSGWLVVALGIFSLSAASFGLTLCCNVGPGMQSRNPVLIGRSWLRSFKVPSFTGMLSVKGGLPLVSWVLKLMIVVVRTITPSWVRISRYFVREIYRLYKANGVPGLVKYLKASAVLLQQSVGGHVLKDVTPLGPRVARTGSGLPRIIPRQQRMLIRRGDVKVIRLWLSLFSIYRVLEYVGEVKLTTIVKPGIAFEPLGDHWNNFFGRLSARGWVPKLNDYEKALMLEARPFLIGKSSPTSLKYGDKSGSSTDPMSVVSAAFSWVHSPLWPVLQNWSMVTMNGWVTDEIERMERWSEDRRVRSLGKLGLKVEPAGKVRVFAMVDCWTQWVMMPLHKFIFSILEKIPQDGTFDQLKPVRELLARLPKGTRVWSYDLSAATDRLPIELQKQLLSQYFGRTIADLWGELLVGRDYKVPVRPDLKFSKGSSMSYVKYAVGQPMGALSSWAMLALTHHALVQEAAYRSGVMQPRKGLYKSQSWFSEYALLGDDIVIANGRVAREYYKIMTSIGVEVGLAKSLVAKKTTFEFAKRFYTPEDASPISFRELSVITQSVSALMEYCKVYSLSASQMLGLLGFGYRVKGSLHKRFSQLSGKMLTLLVLYIKHVEGIRPELWFSMRSWVIYIEPSRAQWFKACQSMVRVYSQSIEDRLSYLEKLLQRMAGWAYLRVDFNSLKGYTPFRFDRPAPGVDLKFLGFLRAVVSEPLIKGSIVASKVEKAISIIRDGAFGSDKSDFDPMLLYRELQRLEEELDSVSVTKNLGYREEFEPRDRVILDMTLWRTVNRILVGPDYLSLVPVVIRRKPWWLLWLLPILLFSYIGWEIYNLPPYVIVEQVPDPVVITSIRSSLPEPVSDSGGLDHYPAHIWVGIVIGVIMTVGLGVWLLSGSVPLPQGNLMVNTDLLDPITRYHLGVPGPYSPWELQRLQDYLEVQAFLDNLDISPIGDLWPDPPL